MNAETAEHYSDAHTHLGRLIAYAFQLGTIPELDHRRTTGRLARHLGPAPPLDPHARLRRPLRHQKPAATPPPTKPCAHNAAIWHRNSRTDWRHRHTDRLEHQHEHDDDTTLIVCQLTLAGIGWNTTGDAQLAADAADRARAHRQLTKQERTDRMIIRGGNPHEQYAN